MSHSGLLFKLMSIGVGSSVLFICREFLSNRRLRVVVDGAISERILICFWRDTGKCVGSFLFIPYTSEMFELFDNRLYVYTDDFTLLAVV